MRRPDSDLLSAIEEGDLPYLDPERIEDVLACVPGEADGPSWHWILLLRGNGAAYATAWCDYTGWGCQDGGWIAYKNSPDIELLCSLADKEEVGIAGQLRAQIGGKQPFGLREVVVKEDDDQGS